MHYARHFDLLTVLTAATLAFDQRIEWQVPMMVVLAAVALSRGASWPGIGNAVAVLLLTVVYALINTGMMYAAEGAHLVERWWAAPARILLYYALFMMMAAVVRQFSDRTESALQTLEWLFIFKIALVGLEGLQFLTTGTYSERPFFNLVLADDSLLGVRFTSSYDFLFPLLALTSKSSFRRLAILVAVNLICETRAVLVLSVFFLLVSAIQGRNTLRLIFAAALPVIAAVVLVARYTETSNTTTRLTQITGSSLNDKFEQIDALTRQVELPDLVAGRGLGTSMRGIVRDELRPYSYEAQVPVLLMQGGLLFFLVHFLVLRTQIRSHPWIAIGIMVGLSSLNPLLFSLASAFFVLTFGDMVGLQKSPAAGIPTARP